MDFGRIDLTLSTVRPYYLYYPRVSVEVTSVIQNYKFAATVRTYADGIILAALVGTIPITYRGNLFYLPLCIMYPYNYPFQPPFFFVDPTPEMEVVPGHPYALPNTVIRHPILDRWSENVNTLSVLQVFVKDFSSMPPLRMRASVNNLPSLMGGQYSPYPSQPPTPYSPFYGRSNGFRPQQPIPPPLERHVQFPSLSPHASLPSISSLNTSNSSQSSIPPPQISRQNQLPSFQNEINPPSTINGFAPFKTKEKEKVEPSRLSCNSCFSKPSGPITDLKSFVLGKQQKPTKGSLPTISQMNECDSKFILPPLNTK